MNRRTLRRYSCLMFFIILERFCFVFVNLEDFVEPHQVEHFFDVVIDTAHSQLNFGRCAFLSKLNQFTNHGGSHETDVNEIQNQFFVSGITKDLQQLVSQTADSGFIDDSFILKINEQDVAIGASDQC